VSIGHKNVSYERADDDKSRAFFRQASALAPSTDTTTPNSSPAAKDYTLASPGTGLQLSTTTGTSSSLSTTERSPEPSGLFDLLLNLTAADREIMKDIFAVKDDVGTPRSSGSPLFQLAITLAPSADITTSSYSAATDGYTDGPTPTTPGTGLQLSAMTSTSPVTTTTRSPDPSGLLDQLLKLTPADTAIGKDIFASSIDKDDVRAPESLPKPIAKKGYDDSDDKSDKSEHKDDKSEEKSKHKPNSLLYLLYAVSLSFNLFVRL